MDLMISQGSNDWVLHQGRLKTVSGAEEKAQRIRSRLLTVRGSWFLDVRFGLDYFGVLWKKGVPLPVQAAHIKEEILKSCGPGDKISKFEFQFDGKTRKLSVQATVEQKDGTAIGVSI